MLDPELVRRLRKRTASMVRGSGGGWADVDGGVEMDGGRRRGRREVGRKSEADRGM